MTYLNSSVSIVGIIIWVGCLILNIYLANKKNRSIVVWAILSIFFTWIALLINVAMKPKEIDELGMSPIKTSASKRWFTKIRILAIICVCVFISGPVIDIILALSNQSPSGHEIGHGSGAFTIFMGMGAIACFLIGLIIILIGAAIAAWKQRNI